MKPTREWPRGVKLWEGIGSLPISLFEDDSMPTFVSIECNCCYVSLGWHIFNDGTFYIDPCGCAEDGGQP